MVTFITLIIIIILLLYFKPNEDHLQYVLLLSFFIRAAVSVFLTSCFIDSLTDHTAVTDHTRDSSLAYIIHQCV